MGRCAVRQSTADQCLLEFLEIGRVAGLGLQVGGDEHVKLGQLFLGPFPEFCVGDIVVPQQKLILE